MNYSQSFSLAIKNLLASKMRAFLTMLGIIIGVAAVIVIVGMGNGMENYMTDQFKQLGTNTLTVMITGRGTSRTFGPEDMYDLVDEHSDQLDLLSPSVSMQGQAKVGTESLSRTTITGVSEDNMAIKDYKLKAGRGLQYFDMENRNKICVIGSYIAKEWYDNNALNKQIRINGVPFTIVGVYDVIGGDDEGSSDDFIDVPYTTAARLSTTRVTTYTVSVVDENNIAACKTLIENALYDTFGSDTAYRVASMSELLDMMTQMIDIMITILAAIAAISLVVGGIGIMNIMLVSVTERTREIGIRKALGAKQNNIMGQFVIEAATTSTIGGVVGILFGYLLSALATQIIVIALDAPIAVSPSFGSVLMAFGISAGIGVLFGYLPAKKAARLNPIDALRYE